MESHFLCICISLGSRLWMSANSSVSNATASANSLYLSTYQFTPSECFRAAAFFLERHMQMVAVWFCHAMSGDQCACVGCSDLGTDIYLECLSETSSFFVFASCLLLACLTLSAQLPLTSAAGQAFISHCLG